MALQAESGFQSEHLPSCRLQRPFPSFRTRLGLSPFAARRPDSAADRLPLHAELLCSALLCCRTRSVHEWRASVAADQDACGSDGPPRRALGRRMARPLLLPSARPRALTSSASKARALVEIFALDRSAGKARRAALLLAPVGHKRCVSGMLRHGDRHSACAPAEGGFAACAVAARACRQGGDGRRLALRRGRTCTLLPAPARMRIYATASGAYMHMHALHTPRTL